MANLLSTNAKLKRNGIMSFGLPAYKSETGMITCPGAKDCIKGCYARQGFYVMPSVKRAQEARLALTLTDEFVPQMTAEIKKRKPRVVRIHDSGDFYSLTYLHKWFAIMEECPEVRFYAYTKMVPIAKSEKIKGIMPRNFTLILSMGGKWDAQIDCSTDRHSAVFASHDEMRAAGYVDTTHNDANAYGENHRIGLVYHGAPSRAFAAKKGA